MSYPKLHSIAMSKADQSVCHQVEEMGKIVLQAAQPVSRLVDDRSVQAVKEFHTKNEFEEEVVRHIETTLARSLFNCDDT